MIALTRKTLTIDAAGEVPGRVATQVAKLLMGKHKTTYTPHIDDGDFVEVQNVSLMRISQKRMEDKLYYKHTGHPGHLKIKQLKDVWADDPAKVLFAAVKNMLPKNKLQAPRLKRLIISK